jgi:hypothetical protein
MSTGSSRLCPGRGLLAVLLAVASYGALPTPPAWAWAWPDAPDWTADDAAVDRHLLTPTAQTLRQGEVSLTDWEVIGLGVSYGVTDAIEASFTTIVPWPAPIFGGVAAVKVRVWGDAVATVSVQGVLEYAYNVEETHVLTPGVAGLVDLHTQDGTLLWSTSVGLMQPFAFGGGWAGRNTDRPLWALASGPVVRVHPNIRLLAGVMALGGFGTTHVASDRNGEGLTAEAVATYGVRFSGRTVALDLAMVRYLGDQGGYWILGFPIGSITVRF